MSKQKIGMSRKNKVHVDLVSHEDGQKFVLLAYFLFW